ncbi:MAG: major capsid family protein [Leptolyngbyaceae cyanobacterium]
MAPTGGKFLSRRLEQLLPGVLSKRYRNLYFDGIVCPTLPDIEVGASELVLENIQEVGEATVLADKATDIPVVDVKAGEDRFRVMMIAAAMGWSFQEMQALEKSGDASRINDRKMRAVYRAIKEKANKIAAYGDPARGFKGMLNHGGITPDNSSFNPYTSTPDELAEFFIEEVGKVVDAVEGADIPGDVLVSLNLKTRLASTRMTDGGVSVLRYILDNADYITSITGVPECGFARLEANGVLTAGTNKDRIMLYPMERVPADADPDNLPSPEVVERHIAPLAQAPEEYWERRDMRTIVPMYECVSQTFINYPGSCRYIDVVKKP